VSEDQDSGQPPADPPPSDVPDPPIDPEAWLNEVLNQARSRGVDPRPQNRLPPSLPQPARNSGGQRGTLVAELRREINAIDYSAPPPEDPSELGDVVTKARSIARRLVNIILGPRDRESIEAARLVFSYIEGLPIQPIEFDVAKVVMALAEDRGLAREDIDRAISETNRIINAAKSGQS
jgi:hypothetical protein